MSFGFSPSDILRAIELVRDLRSRFVDAPLQYKAIGEELRGLFIILEDVDAVLPHRSLTDKQRDHLQHLLKTCWHVAQSLDASLSRYQEIDPDSSTVGLASVKRAWKRVRWEPKDISEARSRITSTVLLLRQFHAQIVRYIIPVDDIRKRTNQHIVNTLRRRTVSSEMNLLR
ncbi:hypothetical protein BDV18DRAFT_49455 [Aspergillus unguis]